MKRVNFRSVEPNTQLLSHVWDLTSGFKERIDWKHLVGLFVSQWGLVGLSCSNDILDLCHKLLF